MAARIPRTNTRGALCLLGAAMAVITSGCARKQYRVQVTSTAPGAPVTDLSDDRDSYLDSEWWNAGDDACPGSAVLVHTRSHSGEEVSCMKISASGQIDGRHGPSVTFWPSGVRRRAGWYEHGKLHGLQRRYSIEGRKLAEGRFMTGAPTGVHLRWDRSGRLVEAISYSTLSERRRVDR